MTDEANSHISVLACLHLSTAAKEGAEERTQE
jgi:hypothetical protein